MFIRFRGSRILTVVFVSVVVLSSLGGCSQEATNPSAPTAAGINQGNGRDAPDVTPGLALIDFETPTRGTSAGKDVYAMGGVIFTAERRDGGAAGNEAMIGLVAESRTTVCDAAVAGDHKLGTASAAGDAVLGDGDFGILATFENPLQPPATISAEFRTRVGANIHVRLFSSSGTLITSLTSAAQPPADASCAFSRKLISKTTVAATSREPVMSVLFAATEPTAGHEMADGEDVVSSRAAGIPSPFVIDNFRFGSALVADVDIRPGSCPNPLNPKSRGVLTVAVLGSPDFDVEQIDVASLRLEGVAPIQTGVKVASVPGAARTGCECEPGGPDAIDDLVVKFRTDDLARAISGSGFPDVAELTLTGSLMDGTPFSGGDCVTIVGIGKPTSETISTPDEPNGPTVAFVDVPATYCAEGATSSEEHPLEYQFDFDADGAHELTAWSADRCSSHQWTVSAGFVVRARARCAIHTDIVSPWSPGLAVTVSEVTELPVIRFTTSITRVLDGVPSTIVKPYDPAVLDTVGMFRPFGMSYHGITTNGAIRAYRFFPLTPGVELPGQDVWSEDLGDTLRFFPNVGLDALESGEFRLAAQCRDDALAESVVDAATFEEGVCRVVVNFDPDTEVFDLLNSYVVDGVAFQERIDFRDSEPDTVPYKSWLTVFYDGWDSPFDSSLCQDELNKCLTYQVQYTAIGEIDNGATKIVTSSRWLPDAPKDSNPFGTQDSTSMNAGPVDYTIRARTVDEYGRPDGTPAEVRVLGNLSPDIDGYQIENWDGTLVGDGETLVWDWWNPANGADTLVFDPPDVFVAKRWFFVIKSWGHDHPKEPEGSGVWSWLSLFRGVDDPMYIPRIGRSGTWANGEMPNVFSDTVRVEVRYDFATDPGGEDAFDTQLPEWLFRAYDFTIRGRDLKTGDQFTQLMWVGDEVVTLNVFGAAALARWTDTLGQQIGFTMER